MAGMDIAEKRLPQDGRLRVDDRRRQGRRLPRLDAAHAATARRSSCACSITARACRRSRSSACRRPRSRRSASFSAPARHDPRRRSDRQRQDDDAQLGADARCKSEKTNIITIEDPIEYQIPGVNQTQVNEKIKLTFASALRVDPAAGSRRHSGRRNPRPRDGEDRDAGRADRPPRALDAAHRRRAVDGDAA